MLLFVNDVLCFVCGAKRERLFYFKQTMWVSKKRHTHTHTSVDKKKREREPARGTRSGHFTKNNTHTKKGEREREKTIVVVKSFLKREEKKRFYTHTRARFERGFWWSFFDAMMMGASSSLNDDEIDRLARANFERRIGAIVVEHRQRTRGDDDAGVFVASWTRDDGREEEEEEEEEEEKKKTTRRREKKKKKKMSARRAEKKWRKD